MSSEITIVSLPCYNANGTQSDSDLQCNPNGEASACCPPGWQCVNNLYCKRGNVDAPGSCTDRDWNSNGNPACPCPPLNDPEDYMSNTISCSTETYLCASGADNTTHSAQDCTDPSISLNPVIDYGNGLGVPTATDAGALMAYYSGLAVSTASIPATRTSMVSSPSSSTLSTTATATTTAAADSDSGLSSSAKIGLGVGVGVGVPLLLLVGVAVFLLIRRRRVAREREDVVASSKINPASPVTEKRASEQPQPHKSAELSTARSEMTELPTTRPTPELSSGPARPAELLDTR